MWYVYTLTISIPVTRFMEFEKIYEYTNINTNVLNAILNVNPRYTVNPPRIDVSALCVTVVHDSGSQIISRL
jgi:hypothetical protein